MEGSHWFGWWAEADGVVRGVFIVLIALSVAGWTTILYKSWLFARAAGREAGLRRCLDRNADRACLDGHSGPSAMFMPLFASGLHGDALHARLVQGMREIRIELENGLAILATIGNTAPFIGLLGTVWGIMHALQGLGGETALTLALVAGPVAEALVATAAGLFAAIPAVMGYNFLLRRLARLAAVIEGNARRLADAAPPGTVQHHAEPVALRRPAEAR